MELLSSLILVLVAVILVLVAAVRRVQHVRRRAALHKIAEETGVEDGESGVGSHGTVSFAYRYIPASTGRPPTFRVSIPARFPATLLVIREEWIERFFKALSLDREIQTGDRAFDRDFYIDTENPGFGRGYLMSDRHREDVRALFSLGYNRLELNPREAMAEIRPFRVRGPLPDQLVQRSVELLDALGRDIPEPLLVHGMDRRSDWRRKRANAFSIAFGSLLLGATTLVLTNKLYPPLDRWELFLASLYYAVPAFIVFAIIAVYLLHGRSSSHREWLLVLLISAPGFLSSGYGLFGTLNGWLDPGPAATHVVGVQDVWTTDGDSTTYTVTLDSWRTPGAREEIMVPRALYESIRPGVTRLELVTRPGRFGFEWTVSYRLTDAGEAATPN